MKANKIIMNTKIDSIVFIFFITSSLIILLNGCEKDGEKINKAPTCSLISPSDGDIIEKGDIVTISVDAEDSDGTITEVRFYIDTIGKASIKNAPYNYEWNTSVAYIGNHSIKVIAYDDDGAKDSVSLSIDIISNKW